jgi:hypothetical protein
MRPYRLRFFDVGIRMAALLAFIAANPLDIRVSGGRKVTFLAVAGAQVSISPNMKPAWTVEIPTPDPKVKYTASGDTVMRWANGNKSWRTVLKLQSQEIFAGAAPAPDLCWVAGSKGTIYLLREGKRPQKISPPLNKDLLLLKATDATKATVTAEDGQSFTTADAGKTWKFAGWVSVPTRFVGMKPCPNC